MANTGARLRWPIDDPQCGAVTFAQRFGGALNLNVHFHTLVLDGIYDVRNGMRFRPLAADADPEKIDPITRDDPLLAARPPLATERLSRLSDGRLLYKLKHRWRDGMTHIGFEPLELLEKLAAPRLSGWGGFAHGFP